MATVQYLRPRRRRCWGYDGFKFKRPCNNETRCRSEEVKHETLPLFTPDLQV
jgi:hypothetical protein